MNRNLYKRRRLMLDLSHRGLMTLSSMEKLAEELDANAGTLWVDWSRRGKWLPHFAQIKQSQTQILAIFDELKRAREEAWKVYELAKSAGRYQSASTALNQMVTFLTKEIQLRQSLGYMAKTPDELVLSVKSERELAKEVWDKMTADELKVAMNALKPFAGLVELPTN